jgi:predicted NUDIX family phosphoesterase
MKKKTDEYILCFGAKLLDNLGRFQGISFDVDRYFHPIVTPPNCYYVPRREAESDTNQKQIIPYALFVNGDRIFAYRRGKLGGEERLHEKYSIGVGGHIEATDITLFSKDHVGYTDAMLREVYEEVNLYCDYEECCVALINDDSSEVGRVHFGIVHLFKLADQGISKKDSSITDAGLIPIDKALRSINHYENWSQLCLSNIERLLEKLSLAKANT